MFKPLSNSQSKQYLDAVSAHEALTAVKAQAAEYSGGMHWKTVSGCDYLYRSTDRRGNAKSLGPRSEAREEIYSQFTSRKADLSARLASLREVCLLHQRVNAAMRLGFVPNEVADVCIAVGNAHLMDKAIMVIGTNAMHAYASLGGVRFPGDILATTDVDLLWNHKAKLSLAVSRELSEAGLLGILKRADKSYELDAKNTFRARSKSNFMVDLIRQMPAPPWAQEPDRFFENDLVATDIANMNWLFGAPRITQPVIAIDGRVFDIAAPDPRAFAVFKVWLSQSKDRDPLKRGRDLAQAQAIIELISQRLPHFGNWGALKSFPQSALALAAGKIGLASLGAKLTPG
jgi:hypothetical protein